MFRSVFITRIAFIVIGKIPAYIKSNRLRKKGQLKELEQYAGEKIDDIETVFEAYIVDEFVRECVYTKQYSKLMNSVIKDELKEISSIRLKDKPLLEYIKDYVAENDINCDNYKRR